MTGLGRQRTYIGNLLYAILKRSAPEITIMKKIILLVILVALGWKGYKKYAHERLEVEATPEYALDVGAEVDDVPDIDITSSGESSFTCDGRVHCSQMTSCDESKYFVQHCPNVKMDGNHDGIPCEKQWCN